MGEQSKSEFQDVLTMIDEISKKPANGGGSETRDGVTETRMGSDTRGKILIVGKFTPRPYTRQLMEMFYLKSDRYDRFWRYDPHTGLWSEDAEMILEEELRKNLLGEEALKRYFVEEILADTKSLCLDLSDNLEPPWKLIAFNNGFFDLETGDFSSFSPQHFFTSKLAIDYSRTVAKCPTIEKIFKELVPTDNVIDLYEVIAYCMVRTHLIHKMFFLYGRGSNGKTTFAAILEGILGKNNIASVSLSDFQTNRFASSELYNKFANVSGELSYEDLTRTDTLKKLSGGDLIRAERKWKEPFVFHNFCKLLFLTNELPRTTDRTPAFYRRVHLIHFPNLFTGELADKDILSKIPPGEYTGLAVACIDVLRLIIDRGWQFENEETIEETEELYERLTDHLGTFLSEFTCVDADGSIPKWELRDTFFGWLKQKGFRGWTEKQLGFVMKRDLGYQEVRIGERRHRHWCGISWKNPPNVQHGQDGQDISYSSK
jgi:putative DNA primase/helicase